MAVQHLQRCLSRAVMFGQLVSGGQGQDRLPQFMIVTAVNGVRCSAGVSLPRLCQLFLGHLNQRDGLHQLIPLCVAVSGVIQLASKSIPPAATAITLTTSSAT